MELNTPITADTLICSDHFNADAYHQNIDFSGVKKLLASSVPTIIKPIKQDADYVILNNQR